MSVRKNVFLVYVAAIPKERSGIGCDVPAHVKVEWRDGQGRRCTAELPLSDEAVEFVSKLPDAPPPCDYPGCDGAEGLPHSGACPRSRVSRPQEPEPFDGVALLEAAVRAADAMRAVDPRRPMRAYKEEKMRFAPPGDAVVGPGQVAEMVVVPANPFKGMAGVETEGVDYASFDVLACAVGSSGAWKWSSPIGMWPMTEFLKKWHAPMQVASTIAPITLRVRNTSAEPKKFAVYIVGLMLVN